MDERKFDSARRRLLLEIAADARDTEAYTGRAAFSKDVMAALGRVPRHLFVSPGDEVAAYVNRPLPIGGGQTISQPYIVALMTDLLDLEPGDKVLEIGTGSGYQAAVLAEMGARVFSVETVGRLADEAGKRLARLGYGSVQVRHGDGWRGWPEEAPFDAVIVTAAPRRVPLALCDQLRIGGRMCVPVGDAFGPQILKLGRKDESGRVRFVATLPVAFVPMVEKNVAG